MVVHVYGSSEELQYPLLLTRFYEQKTCSESGFSRHYTTLLHILNAVETQEAFQEPVFSVVRD